MSTKASTAWMWSTDSDPILPNSSESRTPGVAFFKDALYFLCEGPGAPIGKGEATLYIYNPASPGTPYPVPVTGVGFGGSLNFSPSLAVFGDGDSTQLYCALVYPKTTGGQTLVFYLISSKDGVQWDKVSTAYPLPNVNPHGSVSLISYNNLLYCFYIDDSRKISYVTMDSNYNFSAAVQIPSHYAHPGSGSTTGKTGGPGLAIFQNKLYCIYEGDYPGGGSDGCLFCNYMTIGDDGKVTWSDYAQVGSDLITTGSPGLFVSPDNTTLFAVHEHGSQSGNMDCLQTTDGVTWTNKQITNIRTTGAPGIGYIGGTAYCFHEGAGQSGSVLYFTGQNS